MNFAVVQFPGSNCDQDAVHVLKNVLGHCNGFQILCEAGLLPGALIRNRSLQFRCETIHLRTENPNTTFTNQIPASKLLRVPIAHGEGCYFADSVTLAQLNERKQVLWRYANAK